MVCCLRRISRRIKEYAFRKSVLLCVVDREEPASRNSCAPVRSPRLFASLCPCSLQGRDLLLLQPILLRLLQSFVEPEQIVRVYLLRLLEADNGVIPASLGEGSLGFLNDLAQLFSTLQAIQAILHIIHQRLYIQMARIDLLRLQ